MKIQEMRSGSLHLTKRSRTIRRESHYELPTLDDLLPMLDMVLPTTVVAAPARQTVDTPVMDEVLPEPIASELDSRAWSVVSFDKVEAFGLTYDEAVVHLSQISEQKIVGLCVVTNEAAQRLTAKRIS